MKQHLIKRVLRRSTREVMKGQDLLQRIIRMVDHAQCAGLHLLKIGVQIACRPQAQRHGTHQWPANIAQLRPRAVGDRRADYHICLPGQLGQQQAKCARQEHIGGELPHLTIAIDCAADLLREDQPFTVTAKIEHRRPRTIQRQLQCAGITLQFPSPKVFVLFLLRGSMLIAVPGVVQIGQMG